MAEAVILLPSPGSTKFETSILKDRMAFPHKFSFLYYSLKRNKLSRVKSSSSSEFFCNEFLVQINKNYIQMTPLKANFSKFSPKRG